MDCGRRRHAHGMRPESPPAPSLAGPPSPFPPARPQAHWQYNADQVLATFGASSSLLRDSEQSGANTRAAALAAALPALNLLEVDDACYGAQVRGVSAMAAPPPQPGARPPLWRRACRCAAVGSRAGGLCSRGCGWSWARASFPRARVAAPCSHRATPRTHHTAANLCHVECRVRDAAAASLCKPARALRRMFAMAQRSCACERALNREIR